MGKQKRHWDKAGGASLSPDQLKRNLGKTMPLDSWVALAETRWAHCIREAGLDVSPYIYCFQLAFISIHPHSYFIFIFFLASQEGKECYHAGGKMLFFTQTENSCPCVDLFSIEIHKLAFWIYPSVSAMREGFFNVLTKPRF